MSNRDVAPRLRALDERVTKMEGDAKGLSEVPRYIEMPRFDGAVSFIRLHSEGPWIRYADYTALAERLKQAECNQELVELYWQREQQAIKERDQLTADLREATLLLDRARAEVERLKQRGGYATEQQQ